ncbi:LrgB family protein [Peptoniphilus indolicus]|uniref:Murein hydrolase export regulator LrgB n=2 Tax=Peptoniphilus indolicus TaxID=33030 RepID=G4D1T5_9FIRM|nr:LrgB family protein [Peptoniphilus indolicus]EGY80533.1 murein hydrolase export regulator LrgB [Peptoniphilus indolicus ATCC 29427]SUB75553.1 Holin-like protein CidB [Peptoniphilus indolicus]
MIDILTKDPLFSVFITVSAYLLATKIKERHNYNILNPMLVAMLIVIFTLVLFRIPLENYKNGGKIIKFMISPIETIVIGVGLYKQVETLKKNFISMIISTFIGGVFVVLFVIFIGSAMSMPKDVLLASIPKSVTTAIGIEISNKMGWMTSITVMYICTTGIVGAVIARPIIKTFKIKNPISQGLAIGTASHAVGTSEAIKIGEVQGAISGLSIGLHAIIASIIIPIIVSILGVA